MKVYGALEVAQLEWFTDAGKPAASSYAYRVIWVTDKKEIQVSDGSNWISAITDQDAHFDNTVDSSSTGANAAVPATTNLITLTNASLTSVGALSSPVDGRLAVLVNQTGSTITIVNEDAGQTASNRILTGTGADITIANNASAILFYNSNNSRWNSISSAALIDGTVTNAKLANMATQTIKGRTTAGTGVPEDLTASQATAILNAFVGDSGSGGTKGLVPAPAAGDAAAGKYLGADGLWGAVTVGNGAITNIKLADMAQATIKGRAASAGTGTPSDLTSQQVKDIIYTQPTVQRFTSGSGTYTTPANVKYIRVKMAGGGGGGQGSGTASLGTGGAGGATTFGSSLLTANGGGGGGAGGFSGGAGGTATVSAPAITIAAVSGESGQDIQTHQTGIDSFSGSGGSTPFGGAGSGRVSGSAGRSATSNTGSGAGGGGIAIATVGGNVGAGGGAGGYIEAIINSPSATYAYSVGTGGTAGTAGTSGFAGGTGGSGVIIVEEYYY